MIRLYTVTRNENGQFINNRSFDLMYSELEEHLKKRITEVTGAEVIKGMVGTPPTVTHSVSKIMDLPGIVKGTDPVIGVVVENQDSKYLDKLLKLIQKEMENDYTTANDSLMEIQKLAREIELERVKE